MKAYYDDDEDYADALSAAHARGGWRATVSIWIGAGVALALIAGLVLWSWQLATREPGEVPLIRAAVSPAKERPADPGGAGTPHQDVRAFDAALGQGGAAPQVVLAPPAPAPTAEDTAMGRLAPQAGGASPDVVAAVVGGVEEVDERAPPAAAMPGPSPLIEAEQALIEESLRRVLTDQGTVGPVPPVGATSEQAPPYSPAIRGKPGDLAARVAAAAATATDAEATLREQAATSQIQVQLGAFPERGEVDREWQRIYQANRDILSGRTLAVQQTTSGGTVYFRLRVGPFRDGHEANTVCQALKARGQDCLVAINTDRRG
ncbi:SPOR domain-containing protein [Limibaculum sp. FT325]|uniref:SPOR domain-containing protein n=1 Tax=Thermohalobaculum sediminis TaxID=2939436 RepID=UPI0020BF712B|nr:SPOR domain-containing protein [Limibaculum sediminis]MCL5778545.1 SPOR domain-containing protein [Limibaculum sediminis]